MAGYYQLVLAYAQLSHGKLRRGAAECVNGGVTEEAAGNDGVIRLGNESKGHGILLAVRAGISSVSENDIPGAVVGVHLGKSEIGGLIFCAVDDQHTIGTGVVAQAREIDD